MKTFKKQLDDLMKQAIEKLRETIDSKGIESRHSGNKCLKVTKGNHQHNLDGGRYLTEINSECLVDNSGYEYNFYVLGTEDFLSTIDYLIAKYK